MSNPVCIDASNRDGIITQSRPAAEVGKLVLGGTIVILKNCFPEVQLDQLRKDVLAWSGSCEPGLVDRLAAQRSWWRRDINPAASKTKHTFQTFCFALDDPTDPIGPKVRPAFVSMARLWTDLTGQAGGFTPDANGRALRPQMINYPVGGGFFDWHIHDLEPQRIGLIVGLTKKGRDYHKGATVFRCGEQVVAIDEFHDIGDIALFRYDLWHGVESIDPDAELDWSGRGRWTMVLPLI